MRKICVQCGKDLDISEFKYESGSVDKHSKLCKICLKQSRRYHTKYHPEKWSQVKIKEAFERYYNENGHFPSTPEIDRCDYLPSARQLQRKYGGVISFRKLIDIGSEYQDLSVGAPRSRIANVANMLSLTTEKLVYDFLVSKYGELCVHEQKKYGETKNTVDFFIYSQNRNFAVEVFNTYTLRNLANNLNIKLKKYYDFKWDLYFVVMGADFDQGLINQMLNRKSKLPLLINMKCLTFPTFKDLCLTKYESFHPDGIVSAIQNRTPDYIKVTS